MNDKSIEKALLTWYPEDHPLHYDLHHPLGKLVGEWGELLDDYMKWRYKPDYGRLAGLPFEPLEELIDVWYYIRILAYQTDIELKLIKRSEVQTIDNIDYLISSVIDETNNNFMALIIDEISSQDFEFAILYNYSILTRICKLSSLTVDQLAEASWEKLKPGSERGEEWMKARGKVK